MAGLLIIFRSHAFGSDSVDVLYYGHCLNPLIHQIIDLSDAFEAHLPILTAHVSILTLLSRPQLLNLIPCIPMIRLTLVLTILLHGIASL